MTKTYEACAPSFGGRQDGETTKAYTAFTIYRDMKSTRSLEKTAQKIYPTLDSPQKRPRNIAQIEVWSRTNNWVDRCKDFDRDEEAIFRDKIRQSSLEEHNRQLERFRQHNEAIGFGLFKMGLRLLSTTLGGALARSGRKLSRLLKIRKS